MMQSNLFVSNLIRGATKRMQAVLTNVNEKAGLNWTKTKYLKHASAGKIRAYAFKGKKIYYTNPIELLHTLKEIFVEEIYQINLPSKSLIIDCGANIGLGIIYLKEKFPDATVIAFEPDETNYSLLSKNIVEFGFSDVLLRKEAVWIENTLLDFSNDGTMGSKIEKCNAENTRKVKAIRLKDLLTKKVDFLKMDIEGAEYRVLLDIKYDLQNVQNLFLEYHGDFDQNNELTEIFEILQQANFQYYIKEAANIYRHPFTAQSQPKNSDYDIQLNIFCFKTTLQKNQLS